jgi:Putative DNA-binding domain
MKNESMNIVYVGSSPRTGGAVNLRGRYLARHLSTQHELRVCGAIFRPDSRVFQGRVPDWVMSPDALDEFDVVYMEGGWNDDRGARFRLELAEPFVSHGGQLLVADVGRNEAQSQRQSLKDAEALFGASVSFGEGVLGQEGVRYLYDEGARERGGTRFFPSQMTCLRDWLRTPLEGIDSILTASAVELKPWGADIAACGNVSTTRILVNDCFVEEAGIHPWASVNEYGQGHAVLVGAHVSEDFLVDQCQDNARWISNLIALLTDRSRETAGWLVRKSARSEAGAGLRGLLDRPESQRLERKSSFQVSIDPNRPDVPQHVIQHGVGKSIAAFANTDGGHVIIGQDDQGTVLGLEKDFATGRNKDRDGFEQRLVQYADNHLNPRWETLGLRVHWVETEAGDVAIVEVPESDEVVWLKQKGGAEELYVRRGTRTDALSGRDLTDWLKARQRR